jgi:hypothetical protein
VNANATSPSLRLLEQHRLRLQAWFRPDTAILGTCSQVASAGHCAAVAAIIYFTHGGTLVSAIVDAQSHWFNRVNVGGHDVDVDLTGDQFGRAPVQVAESGTLYDGTRIRTEEQLNADTLRRAWLLGRRAGFGSACERIATVLAERHEVLVAA